MCCDSPAAPAAPNYEPIAAANAESARYAKEAADNDLAFRKGVYEESKPRQQQLYELASRVANQQLGISDENQAMAREQNQYYKQTYQPLEKQTVLDSYQYQYLSPEELAALNAGADPAHYARLAADRAANEQVSGVEGLRDSQLSYLQSREGRDRQALEASVNSAYGQQQRGLSRMYGGQANKMMDGSRRVAHQQALARVGGANQISQGYEAMGQQVRQGAGESINAIKAGRYGAGTALRSGVANFGRNMPNTAGQAYGLATNAGSAATANQNQGFMSGLPYSQFAAGGYGTQLGAGGVGVQSALGTGSMMNQGYSAQMGGYNAQQQANATGLAGLGQLAGTLGAGYMGYLGAVAASDRRMKEDVVLLCRRPDGIGVYEFSYKEPFRDEWGHGRRVGVIADEVERVTPDAVSILPNGYKAVNYAMLGVL